jgi:hypothetical protein
MKRKLVIAGITCAAVLALLPMQVAAAGPIHTSFTSTGTETDCGLTLTVTQKVVDNFFPVFDSSGKLVGFKDVYEAHLVFSSSPTKSLNLDSAGVVFASAAVAPDGTVTITRNYIGLPEKWSWPGGSTITRDAGIITLIEVISPDGTDTQTTTRVSGPHPEAASDFALMCEVMTTVLG